MIGGRQGEQQVLSYSKAERVHLGCIAVNKYYNATGERKKQRSTKALGNVRYHPIQPIYVTTDTKQTQQLLKAQS
jgi:hypothetical protein